ncbi:phage protein NinX family protein [Aeromonas hydrophila]|uniref:phage protein NinX family protein n=1 Tax=Aeromonas hydrophila TaxID=644 RepID=UPI0038D0B201
MVHMVKVKTSELDGPALDWAVAKAAYKCEPWQIDSELCGTWYAGESDGGYNDWEPRRNWEQGGRLIDQFKIGFLRSGDRIFASIFGDDWDYSGFNQYEQEGDTHLIAACRAIVAAQFGVVVEVPANLVK